MLRSIFALAPLTIALGLGLVVACSTTNTAVSPPVADASSPSDDAGPVVEEGEVDASKDDGAVATGTTSVDAVIGGVTRTLDRAQFGTTKTDAGSTFHIEAHEGGDPACPTESSPAPDRTLIVSGVPDHAGVFTKADGVTVAFLDFTGDQLTTKPTTTATAAKVTVSATEAASVVIEVDATFAEGTAKGSLRATYCASLSE